jgi:hypothetical protein
MKLHFSPLTNWPAPRSSIIHGTLVVAQIVKIFSIYYWARRFIIVFKKARHWTLSWSRWVNSSSSHPMSLRPILILSSHLRHVSKVVPFVQVSDTNCVWISAMRAIRSVHLTVDFITLIIFGEEYKLWIFWTWNFLPPHPTPSLLPLSSKNYSLQHPVTNRPQSIFVPQGERPNVQIHKIAGSSIVFFILIFTSWDGRREDIICWTVFTKHPPILNRSALADCFLYLKPIARARLTHRPGDGGSKDLWNVGKLLPDYTALQPRRQPSSYSPPWEPHILPFLISSLK